jgi:hypothetical protein
MSQAVGYLTGATAVLMRRVAKPMHTSTKVSFGAAPSSSSASASATSTSIYDDDDMNGTAADTNTMGSRASSDNNYNPNSNSRAHEQSLISKLTSSTSTSSFSTPSISTSGHIIESKPQTVSTASSALLENVSTLWVSSDDIDFGVYNAPPQSLQQQLGTDGKVKRSGNGDDGGDGDDDIRGGGGGRKRKASGEANGSASARFDDSSSRVIDNLGDDLAGNDEDED